MSSITISLFGVFELPQFIDSAGEKIDRGVIVDALED